MTKIATPLADAFVADIHAAFPGQVKEIRFIYNGAGDDGWFDDYQIDLLDNDNMTGWWVDSVQKGMIMKWDNTPIKQEMIDKANRMHELQAKHSIPDIYRELGEILCDRYPGWEINDGGSGAFIYCQNGRRIHEHTENIMTTNDMEDPF